MTTLVRHAMTAHPKTAFTPDIGVSEARDHEDPTLADISAAEPNH